MLIRLFFVAALVVVTGSVNGYVNSPVARADTVMVDLGDGHQLASIVTTTEGSSASVLLMHQCNRDQRMWNPVVEKLNAAGISTMTVDFRGFGDSKSDEYDAALSYNKAVALFRDDLPAIYARWVEATPAVQTRAVVGASCGGAMASILASQHPDIKALALFSPSLREFWFPKEHWAGLDARTSLPILGIAGIGDARAVRSVERSIMQSKSGHTEYIRYNNRLHGAPLFEHDPNLPAKIATWPGEAMK